MRHALVWCWVLLVAQKTSQLVYEHAQATIMRYMHASSREHERTSSETVAATILQEQPRENLAATQRVQLAVEEV